MGGKSSKPSFVWQGFLLLVPVIVFAVVGVVLLRRDRSAVKQEALENSRVLAAQIAEYIGPGLSRHIQDRYLEIIQVANTNPAPYTRMSEGALSDGDISAPGFNVPMPQYRELVASITNRGVSAMDVASPKPRLILDADGELVWPVPYASPPLPAANSDGADRGPLQQVQSLLARQKTNEALRLLSALATNANVGVSEAGIPIQPLASLQKMHLRNSSPAEAFELASNAVEWPSFLTPLFLEQARQAWPEVENRWRATPLAWQQSWMVEEEARALYAHLQQSGLLPSLAHAPAATWTEWGNQFWLVLSTDEVSRGTNDSAPSLVGLHFYPQSLVEMALLELLDESKLRTPPYAGVSFEIAGRLLPQKTNSIIFAEYPMPLERRGRPDVVTDRPEIAISVRSNSTVLAEAPMTWKNEGRIDMERGYHVVLGDLPGLRVRVHLSRPNSLFLLQRQRERWFGGLIATSLLVSMIGWLAAYRAFRRQTLLNEMKSNFVSSVSHELRAPIASVRLMAESLERGKVAQGAKQGEYYRFIVQECRRLSALIENVLDFSRIEQGRKQYEFEPTDVLALMRETVKVMEPYAEEKGVQLALETSNIQHPTSNIELEIDGRAVQQALVNLIDNAIKHSAKGQTVTIGLDAEQRASGVPPDSPSGSSNSGRAPVSLYVEDHGPGIPPSEHEKIFERFYRLGSELRRETQGVGIGLSIVRHIVAAHGGTVTVRSNVGQGSRFTIVLPTNIKPQMNADGRR